MRQRNDTGYTQQVAAWPTDDHPDLAPFEVPPGGECDHPILLAGFSAVKASEPALAAKPAKKTAATPTTAELGGERA